jgi:NADH-quinone oxidoreductase subunit I
MTDVFEYSEFKREDLLYHFSDLSEVQVEEKKKKAEEFAIEQERKKAEAAIAATAKKTESPQNPSNGNIEKN